MSPKKTSRAATGNGEKTYALGEVLAWLERQGKNKNIVGLERNGIAANNPFGVTVGELKGFAKRIGKDHALAQELWATGRYEAQLLAAFVDDAEKVTQRQMNAWAADFDNWAVVDTVCFHLFDRAAPAWKVVPNWAKARKEFKKRAAFAMVWALSVHDKLAVDKPFLDALCLIEVAAADERNFVKKAVDMALRAIGKRNKALNTAATETALRLSSVEDTTARWVGKHALKELTSAGVLKRLKS